MFRFSGVVVAFGIAISVQPAFAQKANTHEKEMVCSSLWHKISCQLCGCKGGPGYRGEDEKCVGWKQIGKCGQNPWDRCTAEIPHSTIIPKDWPADKPRQAPAGESCGERPSIVDALGKLWTGALARVRATDAANDTGQQTPPAKK